MPFIPRFNTQRFYLLEHYSPNLVIFTYKSQLGSLNLLTKTLVGHTENTWEANRDEKETKRNTEQGKIVEEFFSDLINYYSDQTQANLEYLSYDDIRNDDFKKHAPFDGLLYKRGNPRLEYIKSLILNDVQNDDFGKIKDSTIEECTKYKIYTFEIKSSKIPDRERPAENENYNFLKQSYTKDLINNLRTLDLFKYPKFTRKNDGTIHSSKDYLNWVRNNRSFMANKTDEEIIASEIKSSIHLYTRIFIDDTHRSNSNEELYVAFILGYVKKHKIYEEFKLMSFPSKKSELALYLTYPINKSQNFIDLFTDSELW